MAAIQSLYFLSSLNDMMTLPPADSDSDSNEDENEGEEEEEEEEE